MSFSAPLLTRGEIILCLRELGVSVTDEDLSKPEHSTMKNVYDLFVALLCGVDAAARQTAFSSALEFPELHEDSVASIAVERALGDLMRTCGISDFSMMDVLKPEAKRTRENLSAVINFAKFRETTLGAYQEVTAKTDELTERKARVEEENAELTAQLRKLRALLEKDEPEVEVLTKEAKAKQAELASLNSEQASLRSDLEEIKRRCKDLEDERKSTEFRLFTARQEAQRTRSQIVQSPEKLKRNIAQLNTDLEAEKSHLGSLERQQLDLRTRADAVVRVDKDVTKVVKSLEECEAERAKKKAFKAERKAAEEGVNENEKTARDLVTAEQLAKRQVQASHERAQRVNKQYSLKVQAAEQALGAARSEFDSVARTAAQAAEQVARENQTIARLRKHIEDHKKAHEDEVARIAAQFGELERQIQTYHAQIFSNLEGNQDGAATPIAKNMITA